MKSGPCRVTMAVFFAPVLACCIWIEAITGTGSAWNELQPGQSSVGWAIGWFLFAAMVPMVVVIVTMRSRRHAHGGGLINRALMIEKYGLLVGVPLLAVAAIVAVGSSVI